MALTWRPSPSILSPVHTWRSSDGSRPKKGLDVAIRVARRAGWPLLVAARAPLSFAHSPEAQRDREYFEQVVQPLLSEPGVDLIGEVGGLEKNEFLGNAAALLFPISWPEPFGLVMPRRWRAAHP